MLRFFLIPKKRKNLLRSNILIIPKWWNISPKQLFKKRQSHLQKVFSFGNLTFSTSEPCLSPQPQPIAGIVKNVLKSQSGWCKNIVRGSKTAVFGLYFSLPVSSIANIECHRWNYAGRVISISSLNWRIANKWDKQRKGTVSTLVLKVHRGTGKESHVEWCSHHPDANS